MPRNVKIPSHIATREHSITIFHHTPEFGAKPSDVEKPEYWVHVSKTLKPGDEIIVVAADQAWRSKLLVREASLGGVWTHTISSITFATTKAPKVDEESGFKVIWRGPTSKYAAVSADGTVIKDKFLDKESAQLWIANHIKAIAA